MGRGGDFGWAGAGSSLKDRYFMAVKGEIELRLVYRGGAIQVAKTAPEKDRVIQSTIAGEQSTADFQAVQAAYRKLSKKAA